MALLLIMGSVLIWETGWRAIGFEPSVTDDAGLWALARERAAGLGPEGVVLVGSSRMQMAIHRELFAEVTGWEPPVQLAVVRGPSFPVLRSLAEDSGFRGSVLCEVNPVLFFARTPWMERAIEEYVAVYAEFGLAKRVEQRLRMQVQQLLVARLPALSPSSFAKKLRQRDIPVPGYNDLITPDRFRYGDYGEFSNLETGNRVNALELDRARPKYFEPGEWATRMAELAGWVETIRSRGGQVIFVRLPSTIFVRDFEQQWFPRVNFWDPFAAEIGAPAIHFEDHAQLAGLTPADGEHLDVEGAMGFSRALGDILVRLDLVPGPAAPARR
ncbi:MAG: hypothetical protein JRG96_10420 [Deltaproteobacteria bacterium]|nr:hypothetical protein [Deltaproteobacteria bacterium]MBW2418841.1 hypothetical protein [Deltaproteobacteria bacterium]